MKISDIKDEISKLDKKGGSVTEMVNNQERINVLNHELENLTNLLSENLK